MSTQKSNAMNLDIHGNQYKPKIIMSIILLATFSGALMQTSLGTALPTLMNDFDIDFSTAQQATTWFLLANGIMVPLSAFLATRISTRLLHVYSYGALLFGLILTAIAPSNQDGWLIFLAGRIVTAIAVGLMMPLLQIIIIYMFPIKQRGTAMGLSGLAVGLAPAMGPTFAGWILNKNHEVLGITISDSWRNIFVLPIIIIAIAFILSFFFMVASEGWGNINYVILPIFLSIIVLTLFVIKQLKSKDPFLDLRVFKSKGFMIATIGLIVVTMAMYGVEMMLPTYLQNIHGFSPFESGLTLLAGALMLGFISPISGILYNKIGIKRLAFVGFTILTLASVPFGFLTVNTSPTLILVLYAVRMFGVAILMMPLTTNAMDALPVEKGTHATAVNNTARQVASSIAVALLTSVTQNIINNHMPADSLKESNPLKYAHLAQQASIDGFNTAFIIGIFFAIIGIILVPFLKMNIIESEDK